MSSNCNKVAHLISTILTAVTSITPNRQRPFDVVTLGLVAQGCHLIVWQRSSFIVLASSHKSRPQIWSRSGGERGNSFFFWLLLVFVCWSCSTQTTWRSMMKVILVALSCLLALVALTQAVDLGTGGVFNSPAAQEYWNRR